MGRHVFYTKITPLPSNVPRLLALDLLHSHEEFIKLNPLVLKVENIDAPQDAEGDEYFSPWYRIYEIMKLTGVKIKYDFKGCFHNQSWGMQSHIIGPAGIEMRNKYRVGGNQPGEPAEARELGVKTPMEGLYLREDISFTCSALFASAVKKGMQDASQVMIDRMSRKAELLDQGKLHAMFEKGQLKTSKPVAQPPVFGEGEQTVPSPGGSQSGSPQPQYESPFSQNSDTFKPGFSNYGSLVGRHTSTSQNARASYIPPNQQGYGQPGFEYGRPVSGVPYNNQQYHPYSQVPGQYDQKNFVSELPGNYYQPQTTDGAVPPPLNPQNTQQSFRSELPGDTTLHPDSQNRRSSQQPSPQTSNSNYNSAQNSPLRASNRSDQGDPARNSSYQAPNEEPQHARSGSAYQMANPEEQQATAGAPRNSQFSVADWQRAVQMDTPIDGNYYYNSRHSHGGSQGGIPVESDHQRMSSLSIQQNAVDDRNGLPSQRSSKCPVCGDFEGDEAAVSHHVSRVHFE